MLLFIRSIYITTMTSLMSMVMFFIKYIRLILNRTSIYFNILTLSYRILIRLCNMNILLILILFLGLRMIKISIRIHYNWLKLL